jgi:Sec-independent protein translocase protein TatA
MFGISILELLVVFLICIVILSPKDWKFLARKSGLLTRKIKNWAGDLFSEETDIKKEISKIKKEILKDE